MGRRSGRAAAPSAATTRVAKEVPRFDQTEWPLPHFMVSAIGRLLDELSWEGDARKYRGGGRGLENVLTAEVFQALDFLPRDAFLGPVLRGAVVVAGPAVADNSLENAAACIDQAVVDVLPGDLVVPDLGWAAIASHVKTALDNYDHPDHSTTQAVHRIGSTLIDAVASHSQ